MPRPTSKETLLEISKLNFEKLMNYIDALSTAEQVAAFHTDTMNRTIRDVLAHLHEWHLLFLNWYEVGMAGDQPDMPAKGYTWKTTALLNRKIWDAYQQEELDSVKEKLHKSFEKVQNIIQTFPADTLFEKKKYRWTGSTSVGAYLVSATSSHYDWALKLIKKGRK